MTHKHGLLLATLAAGALALTGCAGGVPAPTETVKAEAVTEITDMPGTVEGYEGAASDASTTSCERAGDVWNVTGTVTNSAEAARDYRIYVSLLGGNDTRGLTQVNLQAVAAGATAEWSTSLAVAEDGLTCVLRVERFAPAQPAPDGATPPATEGATSTP